MYVNMLLWDIFPHVLGPMLFSWNGLSCGLNIMYWISEKKKYFRESFF